MTLHRLFLITNPCFRLEGQVSFPTTSFFIPSSYAALPSVFFVMNSLASEINGSFFPCYICWRS